MARVIVLGAGISGHTAALYLRKWLPKEHEVVVISPDPKYNWIPSNIWVGVGIMSAAEVTIPLKPVYDRKGIVFKQARGTEIHPEGDATNPSSYVAFESTEKGTQGQRGTLTYDYLINATGPKFNYAATPGLGPHENTLSVCTYFHAEETGRRFLECVERLRKGENLTFLIGVGHGLCTCEGAAFEYTFNVEFELRKHGVRDKARIVYITNEHVLGDFGVGGMHLRRGGYVMHSRLFAESLFAERGVEWIAGAHPTKVEAGQVEYETLEGEVHTQKFDFAMLLPPFRGVGFTIRNRAGEDISSELLAPSGLMKVDGDYSGKPFDQWKAADWPKTYQTRYPNIFSVGIAFAPPHPMSKPRTSKKGTNITPAPPRTGMPSGIMGRVVARTIVDRIQGNAGASHEASMAEMGAACVASAGANWLVGGAAAMTMYPIVPDFERFPGYGRDLSYTFGEIGSAGHWIKRFLHHMFIYKAKARPFWWLIPE